MTCSDGPKRISPQVIRLADWGQTEYAVNDVGGVVIIEGSTSDWLSAAAEDVNCVPAVTIGLVRDPRGDPPPAAAACDLLAAVGEGLGGGWSIAGSESDVDTWLAAILTQLARAPLTATALARTLRLTARLTGDDGLVLEALTYSILQGGPEHQRWLDTRAHARA
jgi:hypothetical protein